MCIHNIMVCELENTPRMANYSQTQEAAGGSAQENFGRSLLPLVVFIDCTGTHSYLRYNLEPVMTTTGSPTQHTVGNSALGFCIEELAPGDEIQTNISI